MSLEPSLILASEQEQKEATTERSNSKDVDSTGLICGRSKRLGIALGSLVLIISLAIGIGVGLGTRRYVLDSYIFQFSTTDMTSGSHSATNAVPNGTPLEHGIMSDSSFAAVIASDGSRHVFFQDSECNLRQAIYSGQTSSWLATQSLIIPNTTQARLNTPLSAFVQSTIQENTNVSQINLLYISSNNRLAATSFSNGLWTNATTYMNVSQYTTFPTSRSLSVALLPSSTNKSDELLLSFENAKGNVTGLRGTHNALPFFNPASWWSWENITQNITQNVTQSIENVSPSGQQHATLGVPFTVGLDQFTLSPSPGSSSSISVGLGLVGIFFDQYAGVNSSIVDFSYVNGTIAACKSYAHLRSPQS